MKSSSIFPPDVLNLPQPYETEITCFGNGFGESIVLHIPDVGWGIVDSCISTKDNNDYVLPLEYLVNVFDCGDYPPLSFLILTHPHKDHYMGMDKLITEY